MKEINYRFLFFVISIVLGLGYFLGSLTQSLPDFSVYTNVKEKKEAFFSFMLPLVNKKNLDIRKERQFLLLMREKKGIAFSSNERRKIEKQFGDFTDSNESILFTEKCFPIVRRKSR
mgnify:CR=1 FL=1